MLENRARRMPILRTTLLLLVWLITATLADQMAQLRSSSDVLGRKTSSTLAWKKVKTGELPPRHTIPVDINHPSRVWCRARVNGIMMPGSVIEGESCEVAFMNFKVLTSPQFEILYSINGSARIRLEKWDSYSAKPDNAVLSPNRVLAIVPSRESQDVLTAANIGISETDRTALVPHDNGVYKVTSASILVEDEPIEYQLKDITYEKKYQSVSEFPVVLNTSQLVNGEDGSVMVRELLPYETQEIQYWGRPKGTIAALKARIDPPNDRPFDLLWGTEATFSRVFFAATEYQLPPNSAVNVTLMGMIKRFESPYKGRLEATYKDSFSHSRPINSFHFNEIIVKVIAQYGTPFFLNGTSIDVDERSQLIFESTTTTTTTSTTTTTTTTTTTPAPTTTEEKEESTTEFVVETSLTEDDSPPSALQTAADDQLSAHLHSQSLEKVEEKALEEEKKNPSKRSQSSKASKKVSVEMASMLMALVFWYSFTLA